MIGNDPFSVGELEVKLDGILVEVPAERRSFAGVRSFLESLALQQQRVLCSLLLDGESVNLAAPQRMNRTFASVEAETMSLNEVPLQLIRAARQQASTARTRVQSAVELVLINNPERARDLWWSLAAFLKEPLLTLSLLPETICGPANGRASLLQLRMWQLQQLGGVIQDVDAACVGEDTTMLSEVIEKRVLPWLDALQESLTLWHDTAQAAFDSAAG